MKTSCLLQGGCPTAGTLRELRPLSSPGMSSPCCPNSTRAGSSLRDKLLAARRSCSAPEAHDVRRGVHFNVMNSQASVIVWNPLGHPTARSLFRLHSQPTAHVLPNLCLSQSPSSTGASSPLSPRSVDFGLWRAAEGGYEHQATTHGPTGPFQTKQLTSTPASYGATDGAPPSASVHGSHIRDTPPFRGVLVCY